VLRHETGQLAEKQDIVSQRSADVRALHLHHNRPTTAKSRAMHLTQAGGTERFRVEEVEELADPAAELGLDDARDLLERNAADVVLQ
jgi:hypothetical protein